MINSDAMCSDNELSFLGGVVDYVSNYNNVWLVGLSFIAALDQTFSETAPVGWSRERERET